MSMVTTKLVLLGQLARGSTTFSVYVPGVVTVTVMSPPDPLITESQVRPFEQSTVCGPLAAVAYVGLVPADAEMV